MKPIEFTLPSIVTCLKVTNLKKVEAVEAVDVFDAVAGWFKLGEFL